MKIIDNTDYEVLTPSGYENFSGIKETTREDNIKFIFTDDTNIIVTPEHRFLVGKSSNGKIFRRANKIKLGNTLSNKIVKNKIINTKTESNLYYDLLNVENGNIYYSSNVVSHNCAFVDKSKYDDFEDSVMPTLATSKKSQIIQISTPNGFNHFFNMWTEAKKGISGYIHFLVTWKDIDIYDEEWKEQELKRVGPVKFARNYACVTGDTLIDIKVNDNEISLTVEELSLFIL